MLFGSLNHLGAYWHVFRMGLTWGFISTLRKKTKTISTNSSRSLIPPSPVLLVWSFFYAAGFYKADQCDLRCSIDWFLIVTGYLQSILIFVLWHNGCCTQLWNIIQIYNEENITYKIARTRIRVCTAYSEAFGKRGWSMSSWCSVSTSGILVSNGKYRATQKHRASGKKIKEKMNIYIAFVSPNL